MEEVCLLEISREDFRTWLGDNPSLRVNLMKALSTRLREADEVRTHTFLASESLTRQVSDLETEKQKLLELQRVRQETSELLVHDLRNPLSLIAGALNMLEMVLPEETLQANREIMDLASVNCDRLKRMVDSLLDVARMEAGVPELLLLEADLLQLIKMVVDRMTITLHGTGITLHLSLPAELPPLVIDEVKIDRVLANLIENAVKFTPKDGQITVTAEKREEDVLVSVANTGPTIPPADRSRIFDRFAQVSDPHLRRRGSGLGLAFCRLAVEAHGGQIWVEPGEGDKGNRFIFSLPLPPKL
jgi:signal transduction histidine kinase